MYRLLVLLSFVISSVSSAAYAEACVQIRDGNDGYECMKFSAKQKAVASQYGLRLGSPYEVVKQKMTAKGWNVDREWLKEEEDDAFYSRQDWLFCGYGWDAICWTVLAKGAKKVSAVFKPATDEVRLISVDPMP